MTGLLLTLMMSVSSHASFSSGGINASQIYSNNQIQSALIEQQDWMVESLWKDFGVQVQTKSYSAETLKQLRELHDAFKSNQPVDQSKFNQIILACPRKDC